MMNLQKKRWWLEYLISKLIYLYDNKSLPHRPDPKDRIGSIQKFLELKQLGAHDGPS